MYQEQAQKASLRNIMAVLAMDLQWLAQIGIAQITATSHITFMRNQGNKMNTITIQYNAAIQLPVGWRSVKITATAEKISEKRVKIITVDDIDGNGNTGYVSRTGGKRQRYNIGGIASSEEGKIKNISTLMCL